MFPSSLRVMAQHGADKLQPFGKTIADAVDFYVLHLEAVKRSVPLRVAMTELPDSMQIKIGRGE